MDDTDEALRTGAGDDWLARDGARRGFHSMMPNLVVINDRSIRDALQETARQI